MSTDYVVIAPGGGAPGEEQAMRAGGGTLVALRSATGTALIVATGGSSLAQALTDGYQPAMIALAAVCAGAAVVTALFVTDDRAPAPRLAPPAPHHGCVPAISTQEAS